MRGDLRGDESHAVSFPVGETEAQGHTASSWLSRVLSSSILRARLVLHSIPFWVGEVSLLSLPFYVIGAYSLIPLRGGMHSSLAFVSFLLKRRRCPCLNYEL